MEQNQHAGEITYPFTGASDIQSLGTGLTGYVASIKLYGKSYSGSPTVTTQLLCYTDSGYTISCTNSEISSSAALPGYMNTITTTLGYTLNPSNYYVLRVNISGGYGGFWGVGGFNIYPPGCFFWPWLSRTCSESDLYFRLESSTPTPTPSIIPTPAPFLDLPWNYQAKGKSFNDTAMAINSYFDHEYPFLGAGLPENDLTISHTLIPFFGPPRLQDHRYYPSSDYWYSRHDGYDYGIDAGVNDGDSVYPAASGSAEYRYDNAGGNAIFIDHKNNYQTRYYHLQPNGLIFNQPGVKVNVEKDTIIGKVGSTGSNTSGPHIHIGLFYDQNKDDNFDNDVPYGATDPFGWEPEKDLQPNLKDPDTWENYVFNSNNRKRNKSNYLWLTRVNMTAMPIPIDGGEVMLCPNKFLFPAGIYATNFNVSLSSSPFIKTKLDGIDLKSVGPSIKAEAQSITGALIDTFLVPFTLSIDFAQASLYNINPDSLSIYSSEDGNTWKKETTIIENHIATANINHFSLFALMGEVDDTTPPVTNISYDQIKKDNNWFNSEVKATLNATDNNLGIDYILFKKQGDDWTTYNNDPLIFTNEDNHEIQFYSGDKGGNVEDVKTATFNIDTTPPVSTANITKGTKGQNDWYTTDVYVELSATDQNGSGVDRTEYSLNGSDFSTYTTPLLITREGENELKFRSTDKAGNIENPQILKVKIDKTPPDTLLSLSWTKGGNEWYGSDVLVTFNSTDSTSGSPVTFYKLDEDNFTPYSDTIKIEKEDATIITYYSTDEAENKEDQKIKVIKIDKTAPAISINASPDSIWPPNGKMVNVKITGNSSDNHLKTTTFKVEDEYNQIQPLLSYFGQTIQLEAKRDGNDMDGRIYSIRTTAEDLAGNTTQATTTVTVPHDQRK